MVSSICFFYCHVFQLGVGLRVYLVIQSEGSHSGCETSNHFPVYSLVSVLIFIHLQISSEIQYPCDPTEQPVSLLSPLTVVSVSINTPLYVLIKTRCQIKCTM